jgi:hypothetical protein
MTAAERSELRIETGYTDHQAITSIFIDGVDFFQLQRRRLRRPPRVREGAAGSDIWWKVYKPTDPVGLLPPDSRVLLPSVAPSRAMVGVCSCGEAGCASLWLQVRRDGDDVWWEPVTVQIGHSVDTAWRFGLRQYLDAIDAGTASLTWEQRPRLLARRLLAERDVLFGFPSPTHYWLLDAHAWPGFDQINITVAGPTGIGHHQVPVPAGLTDDQVLDQLRRIDWASYPSRFTSRA